MRELLKRPIAFHPVLARLFGGINEAILWQQIHYWSDKCKDVDGWVYKSKVELEEETTLTRKQQDAARANLERDGWLKTDLRKVEGAPTLHYQCQVGLVQKGLMEKYERGESIEKHKKDLSSITESTRDYTTAVAESESDFSRVPVGKEGEEMEGVGVRNSQKKVNSEVLQVFEAFKGINPEWVLWRQRAPQRDAAKVLLGNYGLERVLSMIEASQKIKGKEYAPQVHSPYDLLKKLSNLKSHEERRDRETN